MKPTAQDEKASTFFAVDLFAGGGGLTVGLKKAGFNVSAAVELNADAAATYRANHPEVSLFEEDIQEITSTSIRRSSPDGRIDLVSGCPPCQGFSSLTSKHRREDPRNALINQMERLVTELQPNAVMMENVPGLAMKGEARLEKFKDMLLSLGYEIKCEVLQVADFGVPQRRRRLVLLAGKGFTIEMPTATHSRLGEKGLKKWETVESVIRGMSRPVTLKQAWEGKGPRAFDWHVVRTISDDNRKRLRQARAGQSWTKIDKELRPTCHQSKKAGFSNVYGRMRWVEPSPTITGGCTTLSMGRFGHPTQLRTISVREAALLQTFPKDYIIETENIGNACNIIGNALPCDFAAVLAKQCIAALRVRATTPKS